MVFTFRGISKRAETADPSGGLDFLRGRGVSDLRGRR